MKINKCPICGREPSIHKVFNCHRDFLGYEAECYDCVLHTGRYKTREEAVAKWNEMTEKIK